MTHNIHILLGDRAKQNISYIKEYVIKYGNEYSSPNGEKVDDYLQLLLYSDDKIFYRAEKREADQNVFISGIDDSYQIELTPISESMDCEDSDAALRYFFNELFMHSVNLNRPGDNQAHVCIHLPLYEEGLWEETKRMISIIQNTRLAYSIDLLMLSADLAHLRITEREILVGEARKLNERAAATLEAIVACKKSAEFSILNSIILVQNVNAAGVALNLNIQSYTNLVGEYVLATTVYYNDIFIPAFLAATVNSQPILGLGMSMLSMDRYYFAQYMLRKAYVYILEKEGLNTREVSINKASAIVQKLLENNVDILTTMYDKEIKPRLENSLNKQTPTQILVELEVALEKEMKRLESEFLSFINDEELSLPEKRGVLAQLLGEDDELLIGVQQNDEQLIVDECRREVLDIFVEAHNKMAILSDDIVDQNGTPINSFAVLPGEPNTPVPTAKQRLKEIKDIRNQIKMSAGYIRTQSEILEQLEGSIQNAQESRKRLTKDGFEFEGHVYRLMPKNIERPLEETYVPEIATLPSDIDLRPSFTRIKDQGNLGSCSAFAMVGIYEYILKKSAKKETELSPLFAYYNARKHMVGDESELEGTSLYNIIKGMGEDGICLEEFYPYTTTGFDEPSTDAIQDASCRKITKALNVERNIEHIKTAIAEGYPVAVSLQIFDSFASSTGFVVKPTEEELQSNEQYFHAMVICGYSDREKIFIVRNSWGTEFGDGGYCYIPYSYIADERLMRQACIITEISMAEVKVVGDISRVSVSFNQSDSEIYAAITRNIIEEEKDGIKKLTEKLYSLRADYTNSLVGSLGKGSTRRTICEGTKKRLGVEIQDLKTKTNNLNNDRVNDLEEFESSTNRIWICLGAVVVAFIVLYTILDLYIDPSRHPIVRGVFETYALQWIIYGASVLSLFVAAPWVISITKNQVHEKYYDDYRTAVSSMWSYWFGAGVLILILYVGLACYQVIEPYPVSLLWQTVAIIWGFVPLIFGLCSRFNVGRKIDEAYQEQILQVAREISIRTKELDDTDMKMGVAGCIIDSVTKMIIRLNNKYFGIRSCVNNLYQWYCDETSNKERPELVNQQPFISLLNDDCLDKYFEKHNENLRGEIRLYKLFSEDYKIEESHIIAFKNRVKKTLLQKLHDSVADFSIYDHVVGINKYDYVDDTIIDINTLLCAMDDNAEIFVPIIYREVNTLAKRKMLFRAAPGDDGSRSWDASVQSNFPAASQPTSHNLGSSHRIFIIRLESLSTSEVQLLN